MSCCSAGGGSGDGGGGFAAFSSCAGGSVGFPAMVNALVLSTSSSSPSGLTLRRFFRSLASSFCSFSFASRAFRFFRTASVWLFPSLVSRGSRSRVGLEVVGGYACAARFASSWAFLAVSRPVSSDTASGASLSESESDSESAAVELVGLSFGGDGGGDWFLALSMSFSVLSASFCFLGLGGVAAGVVESSGWGGGSSEAGWELLGLSRTGTRGIESLLRRALVTGAIGEL